MLNRKNTILVLMDVQGKLAEVVDESDALFANLRRLLTGMKALDIPVIVTEQIPEKLGPTRAELQEFITRAPISKSSFGCCGEPAFFEAIEQTHRKQIILCGIETHICIYQTALQLQETGHKAYVVTDAVSSRNPSDKAWALRRLECEGVRLTQTEMTLFELLGDAQDPAFKEILKLVK